MKKILIYLLLLTPIWGITQDFYISGTVVDENNDALASATAVVINARDSLFLSFSLTDIDGRFELRNIHAKNIILQVTFLGYEQYSKHITFSQPGEEVNLPNIALVQSENKLDEVVIEGEHTPIIAKKDTLVYNAAAFEVQPNEVVEDLLRKMPGVEIEDDGTVVAQGEEVEKVTVDGKEFFGDDPKIATKNLPAQAIDKVEFFNRASEMSEFTGVDDGERIKTMNLELKEEHKKGQFGTIAGEYGTEDRYLSRLSLNRFSSKLQASVIGNFNNINQQGFSVGEFMSMMTSMGGFAGRGGRGGIDIPISQGLSDGFVTTNAGGVNFNYQFAPKTKLNFNYFLNDISNDIARISTRENFLSEGPNYLTSELGDQLSDNTSHRIFLRFDHQIDSTQDVRITSNISLSNAALISDNSTVVKTITAIENQGNNDYLSDGNNNDLSGTILYRKKLGKKKNKSLTLNASLNSGNNEMNADLESENIFFPEDPLLQFSEEIVQRQLQTNDILNYTLRASFVQPVSSGRYIEWMYRRQNYQNELVKDIYDILSGNEVLNTDLSNHYDRNFYYDRAGLAYHIKSEMTSLSFEGQVQRSTLNGDVFSENTTISNSGTFFLPRFSMRHELGSSHHFRFWYSTNVREPSLEQLQPVVDNSDPLNIYIGNPDLNNEYRHNLKFNYINFDQFSFTSLFAFINTTYSRNKITNETVIDENFRRTTRPVNVDYDFSINGRISYSTPIRKLGLKVNMGTNLRYQNSILFINTEKNKSNRYTTGFNVGLENRNKSTIDINIDGNWSYNLTTYDVSTDRNQNFFNQRYSANVLLKPTDNWSLNTSFNLRIFNQESFSDAQTVPIWNTSISRFLTKEKKLELKISAFDLLNQNLGINRTSNLNYVENEEILSLGRYITFGLTYAIRGTSGKSAMGGHSPRRFRK